MKITNKDAIEPIRKCEHDSYEYIKYEVTKREEANQCYVAIYEIPPGKANYPYHYHMGNEEVFYVISGRGTLETPEGDKPIKAGDVFVCPVGPAGAHRIVNTSQEKLVYLDCDTVSSPEVVYYPRTGKVGIMGDGPRFFKMDGDVGYYEGE